MDIQGKVVIITGASMGIGMAAARLFAAKGAKLVLTARSTGLLDQLVSELRQQGAEAVAVPADMRDAEAVRNMVVAAARAFGRVDVLINNAGQSVLGTVADLDLEALRQVIELNIYGPIAAIQAVTPLMRQQGGGVIVNISSMTSKMTLPGLAGYASTKAALNLISLTARTELAGDNIRVLTVYPRMTETAFRQNALGNPQARAPQRPGSPAPVIDSAEYVAERVYEAVRDETAEKFME